MQAIEFEAIADQHMLRLPDQVPDGVKLRVLLLLDDAMNEVHKRRPEDRPRRKPSAKLAGSVVMHDDLITPVMPEEDWDALK
jgi:adenylate kinase